MFMLAIRKTTLTLSHKEAYVAKIEATRPRLLKQVERVMLLCLRMDTILEEECDKEARVQKLLAILNGPRYTEDEWSAHRKTEREEAERQELLKTQNRRRRRAPPEPLSSRGTRAR